MNKLDAFGKLITEDLRDSILDRYKDLEADWDRSKAGKDLAKRLSALDTNDQVTVRAIVNDIVTAGIHDFLFALSECRNSVRVFVDGTDIAEASDGLQGEIFTCDGWFAKYSKYGENGI